MSARLEVDSAKFNEALRKFQANSKRSVSANLKQQAKLLTVELVKVTPPNKGFEYNKKGGEQTVRNDLAKLFRASKARGAASNLASIHKSARNRRGRVPKSVELQRAKGLVAYRQQMIGRVGRMAAGWKQAAAAMGAKLPAWITRHSRRGFGRIKIKSNAIEVELANQSVYSGQKNWLERGVSAALKKRYWAMINRVNFAQAEAARKSGFATA